MGGFHYSPAKPRLITGIRQAPSARALVLRAGGQRAAIISFDMLNVSRDLARAEHVANFFLIVDFPELIS